MRRFTLSAASAAAIAVVQLGCDGSTPVAADGTADLAELHRNRPVQLSLDLCSLDRRDFTLRSTNDYFPIGVGSQWQYRGDDDGVPVELRITVLDETERVGSVTTRVVEEREWEDGELLEVSRNFFAETRDGTVCYFGEDVDIYEDGEVVSHEGAWRADAPGNRPGIMMPADPRPGMSFKMESAPGIAEDEGTILGSGRVRVPAGTFPETIRVQERNPLDGGTGIKVFAEDVGLLIDGPLSLVRFRVRGDDDGDDGDDDDRRKRP